MDAGEMDMRCPARAGPRQRPVEAAVAAGSGRQRAAAGGSGRLRAAAGGGGGAVRQGTDPKKEDSLSALRKEAGGDWAVCFAAACTKNQR